MIQGQPEEQKAAEDERARQVELTDPRRHERSQPVDKRCVEGHDPVDPRVRGRAVEVRQDRHAQSDRDGQKGQIRQDSQATA